MVRRVRNIKCLTLPVTAVAPRNAEPGPQVRNHWEKLRQGFLAEVTKARHERCAPFALNEVFKRATHKTSTFCVNSTTGGRGSRPKALFDVRLSMSLDLPVWMAITFDKLLATRLPNA